MKNVLQLILFFSLFCFNHNSQAGVIYSNGTGGGDWNIGTTWNPQGVPGCGDTIFILEDDTVTVNNQSDYSICGSPMFIIVHGTLSFPVNGPKLRLPCGSAVYISGTGLITANGSSGNSNNIQICGVTEWSAGDGDIDTPTIDTLGSIPPGVIDLGVDLIMFDGIHVEEINKLSWTISSEINNSYFQVERTINGYEFNSVGLVAGAGTYSGELNYTLDDPNFERDRINYYRLKWVDFDGVAEYSHVISIDNRSNGKPNLLGRYNLLGQPVNPEYDGIVLELYDNGETIKKYPIK